MTAHDEIAIYLEDLLEHESGCTLENCPRCQSLANVCEAVKELIFSEVHYPQAAMAARQAVVDLETATGAVAILPRAA